MIITRHGEEAVMVIVQPSSICSMVAITTIITTITITITMVPLVVTITMFQLVMVLAGRSIHHLLHMVPTRVIDRLSSAVVTMVVVT